MSSNFLTQYCGMFKKQSMTATKAVSVIHKAGLPTPSIFRRIDHLRFVMAVVIN
jgi:hypothetical protein